MRLRWLVALAVIFTFVWVSGAAAGPARPVGGDPDIWERCKTRPTYPISSLMLNARVVVSFDLVPQTVNLKQQDAKQDSKIKTSDLPSVSKRERAWR
jgi:hypothetical protein